MSTNNLNQPIFTFADKKKRNLTAGQKDLELFKQWKNNPSPENLNEIIKSLAPIITSEVSKYRGSGISDKVLNAKAKLFVVKGLKKYNPQLGVKLSTFIQPQLKQLYRYVNQYKDSARLPEHIGLQKKKFTEAYYRFKETYGIEPKPNELQRYLPGMSLKNIENMYKTLIHEDFDQEKFRGTLDDFKHEDHTLKKAIDTYRFSLPDSTRAIIDDMIGYKKDPLRNPDLQKKYNKTINQISSFKRDFAKGVQKTLFQQGYMRGGNKKWVKS